MNQIIANTMCKYFIMIKLYWRMFKNTVKSRKRVQMREILIAAFFGGYIIGGFLFFYWVFLYIRSFPVIGDLLLDQIWSFFFFILFMMLVFSNSIVAFSVFYRSGEVSFLFRHPLHPSFIYMKQFFECAAISSWAFLFLSIPLLLAYGLAMKAPIMFYYACVPALASFVCIAASFGSLLTLVYLTIRAKFDRPMLWVFVSIIGVGILIYAFRFPAVIRSDTDRQILIFLQNFLDRMSLARMMFIPSSWIANGLQGLCVRQISQSLFLILLLCVTAIALMDLSYLLSRALYYKIWISSHGSASAIRTWFETVRGQRLRFFWFDSATSGLLRKDLLCFIRDARQWVQFVVMGALLLLYMVNLRGMRNFIDTKFWENVVFFNNITAVGLTIATLAIRFAYPQFSLEGRRAWIIDMFPQGLEKVLKIKFLFAFSLCFLFSEAIIVISNIILGSDIHMLLMAIFIVWMMNIALVALALGMGLIYRNIQSEDPSRIMSGIGGILTLLLSMTYIIGVMVPLSLPFHLLAMGRIQGSIAVYVIVAIALLWITLLSIGMKKICFIRALKISRI
ncbi:MAG: hypothetical protein Q8Q33_09655 [Chlamydiota bacterium]|nr:hypothetical protein [Chlamydiota bacterium]